MKLSEKRKQAIYESIHDEITRLRVNLVGRIDSRIDVEIAQAEHRVARVAVSAAEGTRG